MERRLYAVHMDRSGKCRAARRAGTLISAAAWLVVTVAACGGGTDSVVGRVTGVVPKSITAVGTLTLLDQDGREWLFVGGPEFPGFRSSHLRDHQISGAPVRVEYREQDGRLAIVSVDDG